MHIIPNLLLKAAAKIDCDFARAGENKAMSHLLLATRF